LKGTGSLTRHYDYCHYYYWGRRNGGTGSPLGVDGEKGDGGEKGFSSPLSQPSQRMRMPFLRESSLFSASLRLCSTQPALVSRRPAVDNHVTPRRDADRANHRGRSTVQLTLFLREFGLAATPLPFQLLAASCELRAASPVAPLLLPVPCDSLCASIVSLRRTTHVWSWQLK